MRSETTHCAYCERKLYDVGKHLRTIDHFYPVSMLPGLNVWWNKVIICRRCNQLKGKMTPVNFIKHCKLTLKTISPKTEFGEDLKCVITNVTLHHERLEGYFIMRDLI